MSRFNPSFAHDGLQFGPLSETFLSLVPEKMAMAKRLWTCTAYHRRCDATVSEPLSTQVDVHFVTETLAITKWIET